MPHGIETLPVYRGRGIYKTLLVEILKARFPTGARWAYIWCEKDDVASRAGIERVGFQQVAEHLRRRFLGASQRFATPLG